MTAPPAPIDLAQEADFVLGGAQARPALRLFADATVEPRVMQVLVALARRAGEVVGRDELVALCWEGRIIGEDAIQRAIAKVRKLGETSGAFAIETIAKVGYRLKPSDLSSTSRPTPASQAQDPRPSVAVLPFSNRSGVDADNLLADGVAQDLTAALTANSLLTIVASRATALQRAESRDLRQIGRDLGVRYLVEGNVRRAGPNMRVTSQLVEADSNKILSTQHFDWPLADFLATQDALIDEIAAHISVQVQRAEMDHAARKQSGITAWEAGKRSQLYSGFGTRGGREAAVAEAKRAVEMNPGDGGAHAWLAAYQAHLLHSRGGDDPELENEIARHIERARALDPNSPDVLSGVALALSWMRRPKDALPFAKRAVAINAHLEFTHFVLGQVLAKLGLCDDAIAELDTVARIAPNGIMASFSWKWRSIAHLRANQLHAALSAAERSLELLPDSEALIQSSLCSARLNEWDRARDTMRRLRQMDPETSCALAESLVRGLYCEFDAMDQHIAILRKLWDDAEIEDGSA